MFDLDQFARDGFIVVDDVAPTGDCERLARALERTAGSRAGSRAVLDEVPEALELVARSSVVRCVRAIQGDGALLVRALLFDKSAETNWKVPWHRDLFVALERKVEGGEVVAWTEKDGVPHGRPPSAWLEEMVAVRIHLDECSVDSGPLRVIPGSHERALLADEEREELVKRPSVVCVGAAGSAVIMRPLLLHASSKANSDARRRVLHLEFAPRPLPAPFAWHTARPISAIR